MVTPQYEHNDFTKTTRKLHRRSFLQGSSISLVSLLLQLLFICRFFDPRHLGLYLWKERVLLRLLDVPVQGNVEQPFAKPHFLVTNVYIYTGNLYTPEDPQGASLLQLRTLKVPYMPGKAWLVECRHKSVGDVLGFDFT